MSFSASCGNLPEVERATALGLEAIGLYRTELLYVVEKDPPSVDALIANIAAARRAALIAPDFPMARVPTGIPAGI